ncbi:MAG: hypothetical protein OXF99_05315 [bacterium]|nr:hypothetical protein [bacterium]
MRAARRTIGIVGLLVMLGAGCGTAGTSSAQLLPDDPFQASSDPTAVVFGNGKEFDGAAQPPSEGKTVRTAIGFSAPSPTADLAATVSMGKAVAVPGASAESADPMPPVDMVALRTAARNSPFYEFGDDVFAWGDDRQVVVLAIPADHPALHRMREQLGNRHGTIDDTRGTRTWVQECARRHSAAALDAPDAVFGQVSAQSVYSCLGGLTHLSELFAQYWWTKEGVACVADLVMEHARLGDAGSRPLTVCPSIGYHPTSPRPPGWLAERCAEIVAASPNPRYPTDPEGIYPAGDPLPSCWAPIIDIVGAHAAGNVERGLPDSPHACYHAILGYVWARQTGRESRSPSDEAVGCHYRAFEAQP